MAASIGLYIYRLGMRRDRGGDVKVFGSGDPKSDPFDTIADFVKKRSALSDRKDVQRSWYLDDRGSQEPRNIRGHIHYGQYGFESLLVDRETRQSQYRRKVTDLEQIPLYFQFWVPEGGGAGFAVFQSFQARSCVSLVMSDLSDYIESRNNPYRLTWSKIMPQHLRGSAMFSAPVKRVSLRKRFVPQDIAEKYVGMSTGTGAELEISIKAKRGMNLGVLSELSEHISGRSLAGSVMLADGESFDEAKAEVSIGGRRRTVGMLGLSSNSGTIEISSEVEIGEDGHPKFDSVAYEADELLKDFYKTLGGK